LETPSLVFLRIRTFLAALLTFEANTATTYPPRRVPLGPFFTVAHITDALAPF